MQCTRLMCFFNPYMMLWRVFHEQVTAAAYLKTQDGDVAARARFQTTVTAVFFGRAFNAAQLTATADAGEKNQCLCNEGLI